MPLEFFIDIKLPEVLWPWGWFSHYEKWVEASWNVITQAQKSDFVFQRNGRVHLNLRWRQFSRLLTAEVWASEAVWRVLATHSIRQFPLHFPYRALPCAITFQLESTRDISWGGGAEYRMPVIKADNFTVFICRLSWNLEASTSWKP
jgi:hypothetical protein